MSDEKDRSVGAKVGGALRVFGRVSAPVIKGLGRLAGRGLKAGWELAGRGAGSVKRRIEDRRVDPDPKPSDAADGDVTGDSTEADDKA